MLGNIGDTLHFVAQSVEQRAFNPWVLSSSLSGVTKRLSYDYDLS